MSLLMAFFGFLFAISSIGGVVLTFAFTDFPGKFRKGERGYIVTFLTLSAVLAVSAVALWIELGLL